MTTMAEQVEAEQEEYEHEGESEPEPEPDPEPAPDEPEPAEPEAAVVIGPDELKKAEAARKSYRTKIANILGEENVEHECIMCAGLGYLAGMPPAGVTFTIVYTEDGPTLIADEPRAEVQFPQASDKETCPECNGYGQTKTGAKPPGQEYWQCGVCGGSGWRMIGAQTQAPMAPPSYFPEAPAAPPPLAIDGPPDAWGRPPGHQHWGVPPASIVG